MRTKTVAVEAKRKLAASITLLLCAAAANAQDETRDGAGGANELDEVIVTARLRSESFIQVPVSMNVFGADDIRKAGIERPEDFVALVPNVTMASAQDSGTSFLTIRGLTQVRNSESPVAVVIDGVLSSSTIQFRQELFDIEQIEVLKGPQGALYGRNAIGGAITVRTRQPTNEFEGWIRGGIGNGGRTKVQASVSGPIVDDRLLFRIAGSDVRHEGYIRNVFLGETVDAFRERTGRALLKWMPTDTVAVDLRAGILENRGGALYYVVNSDLFVGGPDFAGDPNDTSVAIESNIRGIDERRIRDASLKVDFATSIGTVTAVSAFNDTYSRSASDGAPYSRGTADGTQDGYVDLRAISQELRLTSPSDRRLRYVVGAYALRTDREALITTGLDLGPGILVGGFNPSHPLNPTQTAAWGDENYEAYAYFGQVNLDVTRSLELSGALRYDRDARDQRDISPLSPNLGLVRSAVFDKWQPKVSLSFRASPDLTVFASYSEGFRSGGFNAPGVAQAAANFVPPVPGVRDVFEQEGSRTVEAGLKSRWFDRRLAVNVGIFDTRVDNQHYFSFVAAAATQIITNIDEVKLRGAEAEFVLRPGGGWELAAGAGFTDSEIRRYRVDPTAVGNRAPYVPQYTVNASIQYGAPLTERVAATVRFDFERRGRQYWEPGNIVSRDPVDLARARVSFDDDARGWSITAWANNLFDERYNEDFVLGGFAFRAQPRTYGVDFTKRF